MGKAVKPKTKRDIDSMTDKMRSFAMQYTVDFHGTNAAIRAGYSVRTARATASKLLEHADVQALIQKRMATIERKTEISSERVLEEAWGVATADVNDLVEYRRRCCRHCFGIDYGYQRTVGEMNAAQRQYDKDYLACNSDEKRAALGDFDEQGGIGFDARVKPNPDCQVCWGDGVGDAFFKPTGNLTPAARALYAGVKQTKDGYQMLLVDKMAAMEKLFKHKGLYKVDNEQKTDALGELLAAVQARNGKLPISDQ